MRGGRRICRRLGAASLRDSRGLGWRIEESFLLMGVQDRLEKRVQKEVRNGREDLLMTRDDVEFDGGKEGNGISDERSINLYWVDCLFCADVTAGIQLR